MLTILFLYVGLQLKQTFLDFFSLSEFLFLESRPTGEILGSCQCKSAMFELPEKISKKFNFSIQKHLKDIYVTTQAGRCVLIAAVSHLALQSKFELFAIRLRNISNYVIASNKNGVACSLRLWRVVEIKASILKHTPEPKKNKVIRSIFGSLSNFSWPKAFFVIGLILKFEKIINCQSINNIILTA